nr:DUF4468 domain-containing protein [uncultured Flavobacterium sp.]
MKKLLLFISFMAITSVNAQKADYKAFPKELRAESNIFEVSGKNATELYLLTRSWIVSEYNKPKNVIMYTSENQSIIIKHHFDIFNHKINQNRLKIKYNMQIDFKDEKVKVTFTNIENTSSTTYTNFFDKEGNRKNYTEKAIILLEDFVNKFVEDYISYLQKNVGW